MSVWTEQRNGTALFSSRRSANWAHFRRVRAKCLLLALCLGGCGMPIGYPQCEDQHLSQALALLPPRYLIAVSNGIDGASVPLTAEMVVLPKSTWRLYTKAPYRRHQPPRVTVNWPAALHTIRLIGKLPGANFSLMERAVRCDEQAGVLAFVRKTRMAPTGCAAARLSRSVAKATYCGT